MISHFLQRLNQSNYWKDIAWLVSGNGLAQLMAILALPLLTRLYTPADFALQALFIQTMGFLTVIITLRYEYLIQLPKENTDAKNIISLVLFLAIIGILVFTPLLWVFRDKIAQLFGEPSLAPWLVFIPLSAALLSISLSIQHFIQRQRNFRNSSLSELANKGAYISTALIGFWFLWSPAGLLFAQAAGSIGKILFLVNLRKTLANRKGKANSLFNEYTMDLHQFKLTLKKHLSLSGALVFSHLMLSATALIPSVFIARHYGGETLGQFALVLSTIFLPSMLIGKAIGQVYYQRAAESWSQGKSFISYWNTTAKRLVLIGLPLYGTIAIISPIIYPLIFGDAWREAGQFARLISISAFFSFISSPLDRACLVVGAWWYIPVWHTARTATTGFVVWVAFHYSLNINEFIFLLVIQMSLLYLIDYWAEWRFSHWEVKNNVY